MPSDARRSRSRRPAPAVKQEQNQYRGANYYSDPLAASASRRKTAEVSVESEFK